MKACTIFVFATKVYTLVKLFYPNGIMYSNNSIWFKILALTQNESCAMRYATAFDLHRPGHTFG